MELLYLPVPTGASSCPPSPSSTRSPGAPGDGLAGLVVLALATVGGLGPKYLSLVTLPAIGLWLLLASRVHHRYVATLEESLQQHKLESERASSQLLDRETTEVLASRLGAVDPKEILYALELLGGGQHATAAHPAVRGLLDHADGEVRRRALAILSEAGDLSVTDARGGAAARPRPRRAHRGAALPLAPRPRGPAVAGQGLLGLPRLLGALGRGRGAVPARRRSARGRRAALRGHGGGGGRGRAARPASRPRGSPSGMALPFEESLRLLVRDEDPRGGAHGHPRGRRAPTRGPTSSC